MATTASTDAHTPFEFETGDQRANQSRNSHGCSIFVAFVLGMMVATVGFFTLQRYGLGDANFTKFFAPAVPPVQSVSGVARAAVYAPDLVKTGSVAVRWTPSSVRMQSSEEEETPAVERDLVSIQFIEGVPETVVPDISLRRARDGSTGVATFRFDKPSFLSRKSEEQGDVTGMYMKDQEGTLSTRLVTANFVNGRPRFVTVTYEMKSQQEWDRYMRFMARYAAANGLEFSAA